MFDIVTVNESIPAWNERRLARGDTTQHAPDLRLQVVHVAGDALTVEIAEGVLDSTDCTLLLAGRGAFEVTASLRRHVDGQERVYLRLRPARSWAGAA